MKSALSLLTFASILLSGSLAAAVEPPPEDTPIESEDRYFSFSPITNVGFSSYVKSFGEERAQGFITPIPMLTYWGGKFHGHLENHVLAVPIGALIDRARVGDVDGPTADLVPLFEAEAAYVFAKRNLALGGHTHAILDNRYNSFLPAVELALGPSLSGFDPDLFGNPALRLDWMTTVGWNSFYVSGGGRAGLTWQRQDSVLALFSNVTAYARLNEPDVYFQVVGGLKIVLPKRS